MSGRDRSESRSAHALQQVRREALARHLPGRHLVEPPERTIRHAVALARELPRERGWIAWVAELVFDSALSLQRAGVRAAGREERRLLYRVRPRPRGRGRDAAELDLRLRRDPRRGVELTGQLLPPWRGARVIARTGRVLRTAAVGPRGEFLLRGLPARAESFELRIEAPGPRRLVVEKVPPPAESSSGEP